MNYVWIKDGVLDNGIDIVTGQHNFVKQGEPLPKKFLANEPQMNLFIRSGWIVTEAEYEKTVKSPDVKALIASIASEKVTSKAEAIAKANTKTRGRK